MALRRRTAIIVIVFMVISALVASVALVAARSSDLALKLTAVADIARAVQADAESGDLAGLAHDIARLDDRAQDALVTAGDPVLSAADGLPVAGGYIHAARVLTQATAGLTSAARPLAAVLPDLAPDKLVVDGHYDVETLSRLADAIEPLDRQLTISQKQLASISTTGLDSRVVEALDAVNKGVAAGGALFASTRPLLEILPILLTDDQPRRWFVAVQNLDEARGTGGILSAYAVLGVDGGRMTLEQTGSDKSLGPTTFNGAEGLDPDFQTTWSDYLGDWRDINASPHFPYFGQLVKNGWKERTGDDIDGVLAFGQGTVQSMLAATGAVTVDGEKLTADNVVDFLTLGIYEKYPDNDDKDTRDAIVGALVAKIFQKFAAGEFDLEGIVKSAGLTATGDRLLAWSSDEATQADIESAGLSGEIPEDYGSTTAVAINNGGFNKLEQFLHTDITYALGTCGVDDSGATTYDRAATMTITLKNDAPASGLPAYVTPRSDIAPGIERPPVGSNLELVSIYLPVAAVENAYELDGSPTFAVAGYDRNRTVLTFNVELNPGQSSSLVVHWNEPTVGDDVVDLLSLKQSVITQPSLNPISVSLPAAKPCNVGG